ncbi:MAG: LysR family transcriptional regulator [Erysipelotrichaceae bacterium]|nr:LysR family transcriptional regulator [Erysipelotrichaceae bacterium]
MLLKQMKYFVTVVDCHSFTEAAELCFISQSAISQQIRLLEEELGVELLKREKRKFTLTPAGDYFYRHAISILDEIERVQSETKQIGEYDDAKLKIGILKNFGGHQLREGIAKFSETYPEVTLDIVNGTHEELYDLLRFGEADMVLNDHRRAFSDLYVNYHLVTSQCYVEISIKHELS